MASSSTLQAAFKQFARLSIGYGCHTLRCFVTQAGPRQFWATPALCAEPMKKRKKTDPAIAMQRELKRKKKLERAIRKIETKGRTLKPIEEIEGDRIVAKTAELRKRQRDALSFEESEKRALQYKDWTRYKWHQQRAEMQAISIAIASQQKALEQLRMESEDLYQKAIQIDPELVPYESKGPVFTPPLKDYTPPDGEYIDTTKKFDIKVNVDKIKI